MIMETNIFQHYRSIYKINSKPIYIYKNIFKNDVQLKKIKKILLKQAN